jgi:glyoxylase-like metal-dependent hydrolase (beta-lactamase superfamily II)
MTADDRGPAGAVRGKLQATTILRQVTETPARPRKQEQEQATDQVTEVAPGVLRAQLPIALPGLGHVNMYILEDERGVAVVDPGLPGPAAWKALRARLHTAGIPLARVHSVVVTHSHPDHFGGAGRLRKETGAEVITDRRFHLWWDPTEPTDVDPEDLPDHTPFASPPWGGESMRPSRRRSVMWRVARRFPRLMPTPRPSVRLDDAEHLRLAGRDWVAVHTPGHTHDHLCLFDAEHGVLLSGDHVLPTITPHISGLTATDSLAKYFDSLDKVARLGEQTKIVLPAHGHPFGDLAARVTDIKVHHGERLERLRTALDALDRPATVQELSTHLFSPRAQGPMADSETYAHIEHLRLAGEVSRAEADGYFTYQPI